MCIRDRYYTPAVCYSAVALAILPPVVRMLFMGLPADWGVWVYRALTFLVISCPCALVISIPLSFFAGDVYKRQHYYCRPSTTSVYAAWRRFLFGSRPAHLKLRFNFRGAFIIEIV